MIILSCPNCDSKFKVKATAIGKQGRLVKCAKCQHKWHATADDDQSSAAAPVAPVAAEPAPAAPVAPAPTEPVAPAPTEPVAPAPAEPVAVEKTPTIENNNTENILEAIANGALNNIGDSVAKESNDAAGLSEAQYDTANNDTANNDTANNDTANNFNAMPNPADPPPIPPKLVKRQPAAVKPKSSAKAWLFLLLLIFATVTSVFFFRKDIVSIYPPAHKFFEKIGLGVDVLGYGLELPKATASRTVNGDKIIWVISGKIVNITDEILALPLLQGVLKDAKSTILISWVFKADEKMVLPGDAISYETKVENPPRGGTDLSITFISNAEAEDSDIDADSEEELIN